MRITQEEIPDLLWFAIDLELEARHPPRRAHPAVVLEALLKGAFEGARIHAKQHKQLWHRPNIPIDQMGWQEGERFMVTVQLFGDSTAMLPDWIDALERRLGEPEQNFSLTQCSPWRVESSTVPWPEVPRYALDFFTPVLLPHLPGTPNTALDGNGFLRICQTRLRKLFGREAELPPPPEIDTSAWRYLRITHRSRSQAGNPMFLNGCVGPLSLYGPQITQWKSWLALFASVGLGERLSFSQGRFALGSIEDVPNLPASAPLRLRRPLVIDTQERGVRLGLDNGNIDISSPNGDARRIPLQRISSLDLYSSCLLSSSLIHACAGENIPVVLAQPGKTPIFVLGTESEAKRNQTIAAHHRAWELLSEVERARIAIRINQRKIAGYMTLIRHRYTAGDHEVLEKLQEAYDTMALAEQLSVVRGWEGWSARLYQRWLAGQVERMGSFERRRTHGEIQDPINALLNFGYRLLRHPLAVEIRKVGLDPFLGILHEPNGRHDALVSDLLELFRPNIDRFVIRCINLRIVQGKDFDWTEGQPRLQSTARERYVQQFTKMLEGTVKEGGESLHAVLRKIIRDYRNAAREKRLADWEPEWKEMQEEQGIEDAQ